MPLPHSRRGSRARAGLRRAIACFALVSALAAGSPGALAQDDTRQSLREAVSVEHLHLVGQRADAAAETPLLERDDLAVLVGARNPVSLNELLAAGIPVRASRLQQLMSWGVLEQRGMRFQARIPVVTDDVAGELRAQIAETLEPIVGHVARTFWRLRSAVAREQSLEPTPLLATWILRHRVWQYLAGPGGIELAAHIIEERDAHPDRPWWGPIWYVDPPPTRHRLLSQSGNRYTLLVCWPPERTNANPFALWEPQRLAEFLRDLDDDGEELDDREDYPELQALGIVGPEKRMNIPAAKWEPGREENAAFHVAEATQIIGDALWSTIRPGDFRETLGVPDDLPDHVLWPLLYRELVPILLEALEGRGVPVRVEPQERSSLIPPPAVETPQGEVVVGPPVSMEEGQEGMVPLPPAEVWIEFSAYIWRDLQERRTAPELPW